MALPEAVDSALVVDTVLRSATDGYYPDSDQIASADLTPHLSAIISNLQTAKEEVKKQVRSISRRNAGPIDAWISQAQQLHTDIEASKTKADEIMKLDKEEKALAETLSNAETQERFLRAELRFNETLANILGRLQLIGTTLTQVDVALNTGEFDETVVGNLDGAEQALEKLEGLDGIVVVGLLKEKAKGLRELLVEKVEGAWNGLVQVNKGKRFVKILKVAEVSESVFVSADKIVATLDALDILKDKIDHFHQELDRLLIIPRLETQEGSIPAISAEDNMLRVMGHENDLSAHRLFADLQLVIEFLDAHLPTAVMLNLSQILIPNLTNRLINTRLSSSVPPSLDELPAFEQLLEETKGFEETLHEQQWTTDRDLSEWVNRAPRVWLAKRRESSLDSARKIVVLGVGETETVGRSETRTIGVGDGEGTLMAGVVDVADVDDWNSEWNDDEEAANETMAMEPAEDESPKVEEPTGFIQDDEEDDGADGWGLDADLGFDDDHAPPKEQESGASPGEPNQETPAQKGSPYEDEEDMDWSAWGEDNDIAISPTSGEPAASAPSTQAPSTATAVPSLSNHRKRPFTSGKDITLTETYTITSIPRQLITLIAALTTEAEALSGPAYSSSSIAPAASGLLSIPTLTLATFRALAPIYYPPGLCTNMYLYNDATYLALSLPPDSVSDSDLTCLSTFARRCYSQEIETQRTVLTDYLDAAQGFNGCDDAVQTRACDEAVSCTVSRLRELHKEWGQVLSRAAEGQSLGSLLNTVVVKIMNDILDLGDISEAESVKLVRYCSEVENLGEELFSGKRIVEVYCHGWRRFGFVKKILGCGLLEVVNLLKEGEVLGEMEVEEVVELVKALFADTEIRTRCIEEIRRFG